MTTCILTERHPEQADMDIVVTNPDGMIPFWTGHKCYRQAYQAAQQLNAPKAVVVEFDSLEDAKHHVGRYAILLVNASAN